MGKSSKIITSYWQVFRLIFVIFFLFLTGDAFYRWDGFRYHSTFSEFLPGVALITVLWSIVAIFTALLVWLIGKALEWFCLRVGWKVKIEHLMLFICIFFLLAGTTWLGKRLIWQHTPTTSQLKLIVFSGVSFATIFLTWLFRNKMSIVQERVTPLVWLFGILVILSAPFIAYHTWGRQGNNIVSQKITQSSTQDKNRPNIILITFDALRAKDMSVYGYYRPTTPFITEWAKEASLFTKAHADSNFTTPAVASLMTGKRLWTHHTYHLDGSKPVRSKTENLPLVLKNNGYYNMAFVVNPSASVEVLGISGSFESSESPIAFYSASKRLDEIIWAALYRLFGNKIKLYDWFVAPDFILTRFLCAISTDYSETIVPPEKAFNRFLEFIGDNPPEPFFVWIHLYPPHGPYLPSEPYIRMFDVSLKLKTYTQLMKEKDFDGMRTRYDAFIRYCDKQFEEFIAQLVKRNKLKNTVIILSSDHGESFEHDYLGHSGDYLYEEVTHIPLIIKEPDQTKGLIINDVAEHIDIAPTILALVDIPIPLWIEGRSLVPLMRGSRLPLTHTFSMNFQKNRSRRHQITRGTIAVWEGDYKLIHYLEENKSLLFNLKEDPDELKNLFDKETDVGQRLLDLIQDNLRKANERIKWEQQ